MKKDRVSRIRFFKQFYRRFSLYIYIVLALFLFLFGFSSHPAIERMRAQTGDVTSKVMSVIYMPFQGIKYLTAQAGDLWDIRNQNKRLRQENETIVYWVSLSKKLENENERLKKELAFVIPDAGNAVTASMVADNGGAFARSVIARAGKKNGVYRGAIGMYNNAVLGRIVSAGNSSSRLLLLTDYSSRVPVIVGDKKYLGIVEGNNSDVLELSFLPEGAQVNVGDYVMTSGHGGVYPFGLAIGNVSEVTSSAIKVIPLVLRSDADFVRIVDFGLEGLLSEDPCELENE